MAGLSQRYKLRKELIKNGIRKDIADWIECFFSFSLCKDYLQAGFKNYQIVANHPTVPVSEAIKLKEKFMSLGMDEETAENWIAIEEKIVNTIEETRQKGYKSLYLFRIVSFEKPEEEKVQERIRWYMSLGLSRLQAEWWTATEIWHKKELSEAEVKAWLSAGVKNLQDIIEVVRMMKSNDREKVKNRELSLDELIRWYKAGIHNPWKWMKLGHTPESASYWKAKGIEIEPKIEPEVFEELLEESLCDKKELADWLKTENYNVERIKEWLSAGVKDMETYSVFKELGFEPEEVKKLLEVFSFEKLLQMIDERKTKEEIFREYSEKRAMKTAIGLFKRKL